ncbi:MAG: MATE family efflux transporter [Eggerthellales bacterium]|nr:MATE family efflux transporter [Eggerthellales bacterium]
MESQIFKELEPTKLLFRCAAPAAVISLFGALYSIADGFFVGRFIGGDALAVVNLIMPIVMIAEALSNMVATGASVNISMLLGAGKREEASRVFSFSVAFIIVSSCAIGALGLAFARPFVELVAPGASAQAISFGVDIGSITDEFFSEVSVLVE